MHHHIHHASANENAIPLSLFLSFFLPYFLLSLSLSLWVSDQRCQIGTQFLLQKLANGISKYTSPRCRHIDVQMLKAKGFSISLATYLAALPGQGMQDLGLGLFTFRMNPLPNLSNCLGLAVRRP